MTQVLDSAAAIRALVSDGSVIAVGGTGLSRKPMGVLRELVSAGAQSLEVVSFLGSVDVELLLAAGAVERVHTAGVSLEGFGLAPAYRAARQQRSVEVVEWSEGSLCAALEAAARRVPSFPCGTSAASDIVASNPWLGAFPDPHTGTEVVFARSMQPDVALLHAATADTHGNIYIEGDMGIDGMLARAASVTVVSVDEIVTDADPARAALSRIWVDAVVELPGGSWPTESYPAALVDLGPVGRWAGSDGSQVALLERAP
jgi:glutaconate CoA-transferase subunit A